MPIYDQSYRHIEGERSLRPLRFLAITAYGLRLFLRAKRFLLLGVVSLAPFMFGLLMLLLPTQVPEVAAQLPPPLQKFLHVSGATVFILLTNPFSLLFRFLFTMLAGGGLIANDVRANALEIYFSRPITRVHYFLGKFGMLFTILITLSLLPILVLWCVDVALSTQPGYATAQLGLLPRIVAAGVLVSAPFALLMIAVSSLASSARGAMVLYAGIFLLTEPVSLLLRKSFDDPAWGMLSLNAVVHRLVADVLGGDRTFLRELEWEPTIAPDMSWHCVAVLAALVVGSLVVFFRRVRPIEVVAG